MDGSDEKVPNRGNDCSFEERTFDCDEHFCHKGLWSCGDGECIDNMGRFVYEPSLSTDDPCRSMREYNYQCEMSTDYPLWTLPTGLCWPFPNYIDSAYRTTNNQECLYLIKCALSGGLESTCPCSHNQCLHLISKTCPHTIEYPSVPLIRPYIKTYFEADRNWHNKEPDTFLASGSIKCRGYQAHIYVREPLPMMPQYLYRALMLDDGICALLTTVHRNTSHLASPYDFTTMAQTFNNLQYQFFQCNQSKVCLSLHRVQDGLCDCGPAELCDDEYQTYFDNHSCQQYRFRCSSARFGHSKRCLYVWSMGDGTTDCLNSYDHYAFGVSELPLVQITCKQRNDIGCSLIKNYIRQSLLLETNETITNTEIFTMFHNLTNLSQQPLIPFRYYCDTFWYLNAAEDELSSYCEKWICPKEKYQCLSGHCIPITWVCDGVWDCPDASDEQGLFIIDTSEHNRNLPDLGSMIDKCRQYYNNRTQAFSNHCNLLTEYPCLLANVTDPLDLRKNRPCILIEQIGDGRSDCYGGLDERNVLSHCEANRMIGFGFRCDDSALCLYSPQVCSSLYHMSRCPNGADIPICFHNQLWMTNNVVGAVCSKPTDVMCLNDECIENARCNGIVQCENGEDEYRCSSDKDISNQVIYRGSKQSDHYKEEASLLYLTDFPPPSASLIKQKRLPYKKISKDTLQSTTANEQEHYRAEAFFYCNRGVYILSSAGVRCFCPPSYYGDKCQFYSDRLTVITHLALTDDKFQTTYIAIKVVALFLFDNNQILDYYEFDGRGKFEMNDKEYRKHRFHFVYSRKAYFLKHKRERYFNRTSIAQEHPYSIQFEAYELRSHDTIPLLVGLWHYPVYFDYLPSYRLSKILRLSLNLTNDACSTNDTTSICKNDNSMCQPLLNANHSYKCLCKSGYYGENCKSFDQQCLASSYCSPTSICKSRLSSARKPLCICPLNHFGPTCHLKYNPCNQVPCLNN
ncbi:unnamed protein product, partial [Didymodactylos carnosus]